MTNQKHFDILDYLTISEWYVRRWRARLEQADNNYKLVAQEMRRQGLPLKLALKILLAADEKEKSSTRR